ncbi:interleukin-15 receptor subunit alpha isoform X3 [Diceros bicornis minor]|uniref:interleukin-15 receptor subunit alpha isoform X3 n=1 Tax=Diceros bicornis minor TaxID=77932 RepID=UPI0026EBE02F|nr:interleukin-15 receptor subunit alpha isoform X3 [Diceros bicornis minor]
MSCRLQSAERNPEGKVSKVHQLQPRSLTSQRFQNNPWQRPSVLQRLRARLCDLTSSSRPKTTMLSAPKSRLGIRKERGITCPTPTSVEHADIRVKSYNLSSKERYVCNSGFKRKAGTSSLTECVLNTTTNLAHWTTPNLKCIRDPSLTHERPPSTLAPSGVTSEPQSPTPSGKGAYQYNSRVVTVAVSIPVTLLFGVCVVLLLVYYKVLRRTSRRANVEMENMEDIPMAGGTSGREEDTENYPHDLGSSG